MIVGQGSPTPDRIFEALWGHQRTAALRAGIDLELFTAVKEGKTQVSTLAERCKASKRGVRMLADYLTMLGFLEKSGNGYSLTPDSETFLVKTAPAYVGGTLEFMLSPPLYDGFRRLTDAVRKGGTALDVQGTTAEEHPEWVTFARAMIPMMMAPAKWIGKYLSTQQGTVDSGQTISSVHDCGFRLAQCVDCGSRAGSNCRSWRTISITSRKCVFGRVWQRLRCGFVNQFPPPL